MEKKKIYKNVLHQEIRLLFPVVLFIVVLFAINFTLGIQYESLKSTEALKDTREEVQKLKKFEETFKDTNSKLTFLANINGKSMNWSNTLVQLSSIIPDGIYLTSLSTENYTVTIAGRSKTREELRLFQDKIKENGCFEMTNPPLQNLVVKEDAAFNLEFKVKKECLTK